MALTQPQQDQLDAMVAAQNAEVGRTVQTVIVLVGGAFLHMDRADYNVALHGAILGGPFLPANRPDAPAAALKHPHLNKDGTAIAAAGFRP